MCVKIKSWACLSKLWSREQNLEKVNFTTFLSLWTSRWRISLGHIKCLYIKTTSMIVLYNHCWKIQNCWEEKLLRLVMCVPKPLRAASDPIRAPSTVSDRNNCRQRNGRLYQKEGKTNTVWKMDLFQRIREKTSPENISYMSHFSSIFWCRTQFLLGHHVILNAFMDNFANPWRFAKPLKMISRAKLYRLIFFYFQVLQVFLKSSDVQIVHLSLNIHFEKFAAFLPLLIVAVRNVWQWTDANQTNINHM